MTKKEEYKIHKRLAKLWSKLCGQKITVTRYTEKMKIKEYKRENKQDYKVRKKIAKIYSKLCGKKVSVEVYKENMEINQCTGIYGIYIDNALVYVGKTTQSFGKRFYQHKHNIDFPDDSETQYDMYYELAAARAKGSCVQLRPLFIVETAQYDSLYHITNRDIESMEFVLISCFKPKYNILGVKRPYKYTH